MNRQHRVLMPFALLLMGAVVLGCANQSSRDANSRELSSRDTRSDVSGRDDVGDDVSSRDSNRGFLPAYDADFARARASIAEAEQSGAAEFGGPELALARDKLRAADRAAEDGDLELARRLAVEADLDADVAVAVTRNRETQALVTEVRSGLRTLEEELRRDDAESSR